MIRIRTPRSGLATIAAAAASCALVFAGTALADDAAAPAAKPAGGATEHQAHPATSKLAVDRDEQRIIDLHAKLKVTPEQETLWSEVVKVMRSNDEKIDALTKERHEKSLTMTAVEDLRSYQAITEAHAAGTKAFVVPFEKLYDSMSAAQKTNADAVFRSGGQQKHKKAT